MVRSAALLALAVAIPGSGSAQSALERGPNVGGPWVSDAGVLHFHVLHRFRVLDPPTRKVVNTPTILLAAGLGRGVLVGADYASSSALVVGEPNEWELFGRWRPLEEGGAVPAGAVTAAWNGVAESVDGELSLARSLGPVRLQLVGRAYSAFAGGDADAAVGGGAIWRLGRNVALAGDVIRLTSGAEDAAWSAGVQLRIPTTPHTVSLHASNAVATTLQSGAVGGPDRLWGFEFTVPVTLRRYFGSSGDRASAEAASAPGPATGSPVRAAAVVEMDNMLRFLPDTVRVVAGETVRWSNTSDLIHTVTADASRAVRPSSVRLPEGAEPFDSGDLNPGASFSHTFRVPGTYRYFCVPHEQAGMTGVVVVEPSGG